MARRKNKKEPLVKYNRGVLIPPVLLKARQVRNNLLGRSLTPEIKETTPTIPQLEKWLNIPDYMCYYCLCSLDITTIQIDHKIPISRTGNNEITNLCVCCESCNSIKGKMSENEFRQLLELVKNWEDCGVYILTKLKRGTVIFKP